jgi:AmmeMemoRadiSam system protein A
MTGWWVMLDLSSNSRQELVDLAFQSIAAYYRGERAAPAAPADPAVSQEAGCFVTLHLGKDLRGCIGTFERTGPLHEKIQRMARAAAFQDPRFPPVQKSELPGLTLDISVLGEMRRVSSLEEIELGRHGIYIALGQKSGTLLPEVALEHKMTREQFVMCCAREKARLTPEECARAEMSVYEVQKFSGKPSPGL